jgi:serine/threonine-protein kinase RsbW
MTAVEPTPGERTPPEVFRFALPGRLEYRDAAKAFVAFICDQLIRDRGFEPDLGHRVISAFVEAFNNAVLHGQSRPGEPTPVEVELAVGDETLTVSVSDEGDGFQPELVPAPDLESLPEGGMGLFIMRSFMDDVQYRRSPQGKNVLVMQKALTKGH